MIGCLTTVLIFVLGYALSWLITCGIVALICLCFSLTFSWLVATGIWLIACLIHLLFGSNKSK